MGRDRDRSSTVIRGKVDIHEDNVGLVVVGILPGDALEEEEIRYQRFKEIKCKIVSPESGGIN